MSLIYQYSPDFTFPLGMNVIGDPSPSRYTLISCPFRVGRFLRMNSHKSSRSSRERGLYWYTIVATNRSSSLPASRITSNFIVGIMSVRCLVEVEHHARTCSKDVFPSGSMNAGNELTFIAVIRAKVNEDNVISLGEVIGL